MNRIHSTYTHNLKKSLNKTTRTTDVENTNPIEREFHITMAGLQYNFFPTDFYYPRPKSSTPPENNPHVNHAIDKVEDTRFGNNTTLRFNNRSSSSSYSMERSDVFSQYRINNQPLSSTPIALCLLAYNHGKEDSIDS